ncbi:MAG: hypothetical protein C7B46_17520 [Sulfobacillus benefaciens]|uniref:Uncharacterized protein n=1 Tax=Sulfobacillus benefaciens TaxID=453960 RepID=A0A2T2X8J4_9FIRM|nr:MAG: hypothetical protein C7B46_17520 [Sulfobacillus benefaciens]
MEPTQFLMRYGHVGLGSARTMDTYTERLIPFCRWIGAAQVLVVCGHQDTAKRTMLRDYGLEIASEWYVKGLK